MSKFKKGEKVKYIKTSMYTGRRVFSIYNDKIATIVDVLSGDFYQVKFEPFGTIISQEAVCNECSLYPIDNIKIDESKLNEFLR